MMMMMMTSHQFMLGYCLNLNLTARYKAPNLLQRTNYVREMEQAETWHRQFLHKIY